MAMQETHTTTVDNLFAASQIMPVVADSMMVKTSQGVLKRGALLDKDGTLCKVDSGKTTISAVYAVLAEDVDTASGDKVAAVYLTCRCGLQAVCSSGQHLLQAEHLNLRRDYNNGN